MKRTIALLAAILAFAPACQVHGLAFIEDQRVEIVSPDYREIVDLPITIDWDVTDEALEDRLGDDVQFGVYIDVDPQPPDESLDYFARNDKTCLRSKGCPNTKYLSDRGINVTTETDMGFRFLPIAPGVDLARGDPDFHDVTIVLLDEDGVRIGESGWSTTFEIDRQGD